MDTTSPGDDALIRQIDGELRLLHEAILLVATGTVPRALVAGLRLGRAVLPGASRLAADAGVRLVPLWTTDEQLFDIAVERVGP